MDRTTLPLTVLPKEFIVLGFVLEANDVLSVLHQQLLRQQEPHYEVVNLHPGHYGPTRVPAIVSGEVVEGAPHSYRLGEGMESP